jgi:hypothetical protein
LSPALKLLELALVHVRYDCVDLFVLLFHEAAPEPEARVLSICRNTRLDNNHSNGNLHLNTLEVKYHLDGSAFHSIR